MKKQNSIKKPGFGETLRSRICLALMFSLLSNFISSCGKGGSQLAQNTGQDYGSVLGDQNDAQIRSLVGDSASQLIEFDLIDASRGSVVPGFSNLQNNQVLNLKDLPSNLSVVARVPASLGVKSVKIALGDLRKIEGEAPYALFGDKNGKYNSQKLPLGEVNLVASAHSALRAKGEVLALVQIKLVITDEEVGGGTTTTGGGSTAGTTTGDDNPSGTASEVNGIVRIETESQVPSNPDWKIRNTDGRDHIVWTGTSYETGAAIGSIPSSAHINYAFRVNSGGLFKLIIHSRRDTRGRPLPAHGEDCNGLAGSQELCFDLENDVYVGVDTVQVPEKLYMHIFYYNDPSKMEVFPYDEWVTGGRVDRPTRTVPVYRLPAGGEYNLKVIPRSKDFMIDAFELVRLDDSTSGGGGGSGSGGSSSSVSGSDPVTGGVLASPSSAALNEALTQGFIRFNRSYNGGTNGARDGGASLVLATAAYAGTASGSLSLESIDNRLLEQLRFTLTGGNEPMANGGYPAQHESLVTSMMVLVKNTPRVYSRLSAQEKSKMDTLMKAVLISSAHTTADGSRSYGMDGDSNIYRDGNSNYREGMVGGVLIGVAYMGVDAASAFMSNYKHTDFLEEIRLSGLTNIHSTWTWNVTNESSGRGPWIKPSASEIETNIRNYKYKTHTVRNYMNIYQELLNHTLGKNVACGITHASGCGKIDKNCSGIPNLGRPGMVQEFDTGSGGGRRSSALYATDSLRAHQSNRLALIAGGLWDKSNPIAQVAKDKVDVAVRDLRYKLEQGYRDLSNNACTSTPVRSFQTTQGNYSVGLKYIFPLFEDSLRAFDNSSGGGSGGGTTGGTSGGGIGTNDPCSNGMLHNETRSINMFTTPSVVAPAVCQSVLVAVEKCTNGVLIPLANTANRFPTCIVEQPSGGGGTNPPPIPVGIPAPEAAVNGKPWCYANRNNWDLIPNAHVKRNVGPISPESSLVDFKTKYPGDFTMSGSTVVIQKGNKVYSGFKTTYGIDINASNVTLRDFVVSMGGVKVLSTIAQNQYAIKNIVLENGEMRRTNNFEKIIDGSGIGLLGPNWSAYRVYIHGYGDAVRTEGNNLLAYSLTRRLGPGPNDHADMAQSISRSGKPPINNVFFVRNFFLHIQTEDEKFFPTDNRAGKMNNVLNLMGGWKAYDNIIYSQSFVASGSKGSTLFNNCLKTNGRTAYGASDWDPNDWRNNINLDTGNLMGLRGD